MGAQKYQQIVTVMFQFAPNRIGCQFLWLTISPSLDKSAAQLPRPPICPEFLLFAAPNLSVGPQQFGADSTASRQTFLLHSPHRVSALGGTLSGKLRTVCPPQIPQFLHRRISTRWRRIP